MLALSLDCWLTLGNLYELLRLGLLFRKIENEWHLLLKVIVSIW